MGGTLINPNQETGATMNKPSAKTKIIKRYQNRKLYDTQQSCYVTLDDIAKMIRTNEDVMVIDNKTKNDITAATLTQIIFESEKKSTTHAPLFTLREIIQNGNGSISSYLAKLGAFSQDQITETVRVETPAFEQRVSTDDIKQSLDQRIANAANLASGEKSLNEPTPKIPAGFNADDTPDLPASSNQGFNN